ncbi:MAG: glycosyltransferase family 39 protein [Chloroflexota bacterium]
METNSNLLFWLFGFVLFIVSFLPRAIYPVSRSPVWHERGQIFIENLTQGVFESTVQSSHPGVLTMWIVGLTQWVGNLWLDGAYFDQAYIRQLEWEIFSLALVISLTIVITFFLLKRLFDPFAAMIGSLLLAVDPFHISISKTVHVDALMSVLMMVSALMLLVWLKEGQDDRQLLMLSGVFGGLGIITKTPGIFILPYFGLAVISWRFYTLWRAGCPPFTVQSSRGSIPLFFKSLFFWLIPLLLTSFILTPSLWIAPGSTLSLIMSGSFSHVQNAHPNPIVFLNMVFEEDPGWWFYPVNIAVKMNEVVYVMMIGGVLALLRPEIKRPYRLMLLLFLLFALFFTLQMTLGSKKFMRYVLPAHQFIILFAGIGSVSLFRTFSKISRFQRQSGFMVTVLFLATLSFSLHPYYGTHYNFFLGSGNLILGENIVAGQEQGEGLDLAADYLNGLPNAQLLSVGAQINESFRPYFVGRATTMLDQDLDYLVFSRNWTIRGMSSEEWLDSWERYQYEEPKFVVESGNVPFVWVYKTMPEPADVANSTAVNALYGKQIGLLGYRFEPAQVMPGESVKLTLFWEMTEPWRLENPVENNFTVFTHLTDETDKIYGQHDGPPNDGRYPTYLWDSGDVIKDEHLLVVDSDTPEGEYQFAIGLYHSERFNRLDVVDNDGEGLENGRLLLAGPIILSSN